MKGVDESVFSSNVYYGNFPDMLMDARFLEELNAKVFYPEIGVDFTKTNIISRDYGVVGDRRGGDTKEVII